MTANDTSAPHLINMSRQKAITLIGRALTSHLGSEKPSRSLQGSARQCLDMALPSRLSTPFPESRSSILVSAFAAVVRYFSYDGVLWASEPPTSDLLIANGFHVRSTDEHRRALAGSEKCEGPGQAMI